MATSLNQPVPGNLDDFGYPTRPDARGRLRHSGVRASKRILNMGIFVCLSIAGGLLKMSRAGRRYPALPMQFTPVRRILVI
ncbi:MAG TPA: hypothetical protein VGT44_10875, partial [Ktedonobacteraceae bacterium]|nr:hypothetical protein [Ktedonobacteraceae bacterium]